MVRYERDPDAEVEEIRRPCKLVLTGGKQLWKNVLVVRCECHAEIEGPLGNYYNYDTLGTVKTIEEALELYRNHTPHVWKRVRYRTKKDRRRDA